jgi:hypothetical protein
VNQPDLSPEQEEAFRLFQAESDKARSARVQISVTPNVYSRLEFLVRGTDEPLSRVAYVALLIGLAELERMYQEQRGEETPPY